MKTILTLETLEKYLSQGYYLMITQESDKKDDAILMTPNGEKKAIVPYHYYIQTIGVGTYYGDIAERLENGEDNIIIKEFRVLEQKLAKKKEKERRMAELKWAIEYFNGKALEEGDNITITAEFLDSLEVLLENAKRK